jgi:anti-anti-sigma regulatory factor
MSATAIPACFKLGSDGLAESLQRALEGAGESLVLDFSSIARVDASALRALEKLADEAAAKNIEVVLRGVNVDVYKVLKLARLTRRFSFKN